MARGLSVREVERLAKAKGDKRPAKAAAAKPEKDADTLALESDLSAALGMKVSIDHKVGQEAGALMVRYQTLDELDDLCRKLGA